MRARNDCREVYEISRDRTCGEGKQRSASDNSIPVRLKLRRDFVRAGQGRRWHGKSFTMQMIEAPDEARASARVGFTLTKKVGCAVVRNRARRRLREAVRLDPAPFRPAHDYVIVGRTDALRVSFATLLADLRVAADSTHTRRPGRDGARRGASKSRPERSLAPDTARDETSHNGSQEPGRIRPEP